MPHLSYLNPKKKTWYLSCRRMCGPYGQAEWIQKISPPPRFELCTIQPMESHYTDYTIPAIIQYRIEIHLRFSLNSNSVWNISFYEVPFLLISGNSREGYAFSISEARSTLKRLVIHKWIIPDGIFHIFLPNQHQTLCAVLILGDIFLRKDDSLKETSHSININTHAM